MSNAECRMADAEGQMREEKGKYDLEERLVAFAADVIGLTETLPNSRAGNHIAAQLLRSGTAPAPNYGEAEAAESRKDFLHKMGICLKELRESRLWFRLIQRRGMLGQEQLAPLLVEVEELTRIFRASIATAQRNGSSDSP
jgi:four helix bundle protein